MRTLRNGYVGVLAAIASSALGGVAGGDTRFAGGVGGRRRRERASPYRSSPCSPRPWARSRWVSRSGSTSLSVFSPCSLEFGSPRASLGARSMLIFPLSWQPVSPPAALRGGHHETRPSHPCCRLGLSGLPASRFGAKFPALATRRRDRDGDYVGPRHLAAMRDPSRQPEGEILLAVFPSLEHHAAIPVRRTVA